MNYFMTEVLKIKLFLRAPLQLEGKTASPTGITLVLSPVPPLKFSLKSLTAFHWKGTEVCMNIRLLN